MRLPIEKAIEKIAEQAGPQDVFMLTLSGHGVMVGQRYFFLPHEFTSKDEGGWEDDAKLHGLPNDALLKWINKVPALKRVVVYDTCQSGAAVAADRGTGCGWVECPSVAPGSFPRSSLDLRKRSDILR